MTCSLCCWFPTALQRSGHLNTAAASHLCGDISEEQDGLKWQDRKYQKDEVKFFDFLSNGENQACQSLHRRCWLIVPA